MSAYTQQETQINDADLLVECLKEKGFKEVEKYDTPQQLIGYGGDKRKDTAEVIVRRKHVGGASNDIGFKKQADGNYTAIISSYDSHRHNATWMAELKRSYADKKVRKVARANGLTFLKRTETPNGSFKLQFVKS